MSLSQFKREAVDGFLCRHFLIEYAVDTVENRHVDAVAFVYFIDALCAVVSFCNHFHLHHRRFDRIAAAYVGAEIVVAGEFGVCRDEKVAKIHGVADVALAGAGGGEEAFHLADGVACDHGEEVVAVFQAVDYASADAVNVFKHGAVFNAGNVARHYGAQRRTLKAWGECGGKRRVEAANGEVGGGREPLLLRGTVRLSLSDALA